MKTLYLIHNPLTGFPEGTTYAVTPQAGRQHIALTKDESAYMRDSIMPVYGGWQCENVAARYVSCSDTESPVITLQAGMSYRLRTRNEIWQEDERRKVQTYQRLSDEGLLDSQYLTEQFKLEEIR